MTDQKPVSLDHLLDEGAGRPKSFTIGGEVFGLPAKFPFGAAILLDRGKIDLGLQALFGSEEEVDRFLPYFSPEVIQGIASEVYGLDLGESSASSPSSKTTGTRSRPTSKRSTPSTSRKR